MIPRPAINQRPTVLAKPRKVFSIEKWDGSKSGEKIIIYAETGMGKTTLSSLAPNPVFIGLDDGGRKLRHPTTGELLNVIPGVDTFDDVRMALNASITLDCDTVVIDTITILESWAEKWTLDHVAGPQNSKPENIESYGYNKGYKHLYDTMKLILLDLDKISAAGKNIILVAQSTNNKIANPGGEDFLCNGPRLYNGKPSILSLYTEWADHILRIDYQGLFVNKKSKIAAYGKASGDTTRVIYTKPEVFFMAKSRTISDPVITFSTQSDDSIWQIMFNKKGVK